MAIRIITDSTSDIPVEQQQFLGIDIVPLSVIFGDKRYTDGIDLKKEQFYEMLSKSTSLPTTSQVNPDGFESLFKSYTDAGDTVIGIFISSKLSGTYQSAIIAKETVGSDRIFIVDSKSATFGLALLVYEAIKLRDNGVSAEEIYNTLVSLSSRVKFYAVVNTLKYLKMGGRLSSSAAILGGVLQIKPLVSIVDGEVKSVAKERGQKAAFSWILEKLKKDEPDMRYPFALGHSNALEVMEEFIAYITPSIEVKNPIICEIGCVIGTHSGPGCVGLAYIPKG
ncbi:MAG: DegV family protein [Bacillota bacterium]